jgi:hypothetical protein
MTVLVGWQLFLARAGNRLGLRRQGSPGEIEFKNHTSEPVNLLKTKEGIF